MSFVPAHTSEAAFRSLVRSVRLLSALGAMAMALSGECETLFLAVFLSLFLLGYQVEKYPRLLRMMVRLQPFLAGLIFFVGLLDFFFLSNSFLLAVAHFLLSLQGVRLLALTTPRENLGAILIASMMILSASTLSVEWTFFGMLFLFLAVVIWALMVHTVVLENEGGKRIEGEPEKPLPWSAMVPVVRGSAGLALLTAVLCCAFVFVVFPRFNFQGFRGQFLQPVHRSGFNNQVDLQTGGRILNDDSVVMRVEVAESERKNWTGYLRGGVLEQFDGRVWQNAPERRERLYRNTLGEFPLGFARGGPERRIRQSIYLESMDSPILFAVADPVLVRIDRPFLELSPDGVVRRSHGDSWRVHYDVLSYAEPMGSPIKGPSRSFDHRSQINDATGLLLSLPPDLDPRIHEFARTATDGLRGLEAAKKLTQALQSDYGYTLDIKPPAAGQDPIAHFLFERKEGHCEYFASALAVLLRSRGIPSRLVTGFNSQELNDRGGYYVVRMRHAHAWVEAYIESAGWVAFDATPDVPDNQRSPTLVRLEKMWDFINLRWNRYILSYDIQRQVSILRSITTGSRQISFRFEDLAKSGKRLEEWVRAFRASPGSWKSIPRDGLMAALASLVFVVLFVTAFLVWRRKTNEISRVWFYRRFLGLLEKSAGQKPAGMTLREFTFRHAAPAEAMPDIHFLTDRYYGLRFGSETPGESRLAVRSALTRLSRQLKRHSAPFINKA